MGEVWLPQWQRVDLGGPSGKPYRHGQNIKVLWHTWEGTNWSAAESAFAPYPPHVGVRFGDVPRQYIPLDEHAFALAGSHNEDEFVIQIELAGFAHETAGWPQDKLEWIAHNVLEPILYFHDVPDQHPPFYDDTDGITLASKTSPIRFSPLDWAEYSGHVGHQHAPYPDEHWDPGKLDVDTIIRAARSNGHQLQQQLGGNELIEATYVKVKGEPTVYVAGRTLLRPWALNGADPGAFNHAREQAMVAGIHINEDPPASVYQLEKITIGAESHNAAVIESGRRKEFGL